MPVEDYSTDPNSNTEINGINVAEGCAPGNINNAIRQLMADVADGLVQYYAQAKTSAQKLIARQNIGLGNVDDTSDANKPVSTATQTALNGKVDTSDSRLTNAREWTASTVSQAEAEAGTATTRRAWTAQRVRQAIQALAIGEGQTWQDVKSTRTIDTTYQNTTGRTIVVSLRVSGTGSGPSFSAGAAADALVPLSGNSQHGLSGGLVFAGQWEVPSGHYYRVTGGTSPTVRIWAELR